MRLFSPLRLLSPACRCHRAPNHKSTRPDGPKLSLQARQVRGCQQVPQLTADKAAGGPASSQPDSGKPTPASFRQPRRDRPTFLSPQT